MSSLVVCALAIPITSYTNCIHFILYFQADASTAQENKVTVTLIAVVILFLVCQTPSAIQLIYTMNATEHTNMTRGNWFASRELFFFYYLYYLMVNIIWVALDDRPDGRV